MEVGRLLREKCVCDGARVLVTHMAMITLIKSRKSQSLVGLPRAERVRGGLAREVEAGTAILVDPEGCREEWMGPMERATAEIRLKMTWEEDCNRLQELGHALEREEDRGGYGRSAVLGDGARGAPRARRTVCPEEGDESVPENSEAQA